MPLPMRTTSEEEEEDILKTMIRNDEGGLSQVSEFGADFNWFLLV